MKNFLKPITLLIIAIAAVITAFTQSDAELDKLLAKLEKFRGDYPQEKVYLQLDKPIYSLNEEVWLKGYVVNAEENELSATSKVLYVDLLDARDSVIKSLLLPLENGMANANMHLETQLEPGAYHICAYTKWMQNFSSDYYFRKDITIVNALPGAINGELTYVTKPSDNGKLLDASIIYHYSDGTVAPGKTVKYTVYAGDRFLFSGKGITGATGDLAISGNIRDAHKNTVLKIQATLQTSDKSGQEQVFSIRPLAITADVQFFPEGGRLVKGLRTKVAFKATKPDGHSEAITGKIVDEQNNELAEIQAEHAGMGIFALQPLPEKTYTAIIKHEDGSESKHTLPKADDAGYVLNINRVGNDSLSVRISASQPLVDGREVVLIGQTSGVTKFAARIKIDAASKVSYIPLKKFRTGIAQFTLFTPDYQPVAERLVFCDRNDQLRTDAKTDKTTYNKREKTNINVRITDQDDKGIVGVFAVSVTPAQIKISEDDEIGILCNLLLTSDLKGHIEQPNYYFNPANADRLKHLDQLLLTQGWRRFDWTDLKADKYPQVKYKPEQGITLTGTITTLGGKPVPNGKVTLFGRSTAGIMVVDTVADQQGRFVFEQLDFSDSAKVIVKATNAKERNSVRITLDVKPEIPRNPTYLGGLGTDATGYSAYMNAQFKDMSKFGALKNTIALKEVNIRDTKLVDERKTVPHSASLAPGIADIVLKPEKLTQYTNMLQAFYGLPGIAVRDDKVYAIRSMNKSLTNGDPSMQLIVDGAMIPKSMTSDILKSIFPDNVAGVEFLIGGSATIYGNDGFFGVVIITSKRGANTASRKFNIAHYAPQGYAVVKEFFAPVYDGSTKDNGMADLRSTIYWNPNVVTDADGKTNFSFYNADAVGNYKVTLEGLDTHGKLARKVFTYTVK